MSVRNFSYMPVMGNEGYFDPPMPEPPITDSLGIWHSGLNPFDRLYYHKTLNAVRKNRRFHQTPLIPKDSLDYVLCSYYNHSEEIFPDKIDTVLQLETVGKRTFKILRNRKDLKVIQTESLGHPLKIGGISQKISPHSVKLINIGHHTQITNKGFSRQPADGTFFCY